MQPQPLKGFMLFLALLGLSLSTFMIVLDYSIANVCIPYIAGDLGVSNDQGTYVITSFAVGSAIALPISGWLTKRIGSVRLLLIALVLFSFFSLACGLARNLQILVVSRFLQGFASGPMIPLSQTLLISCNPPEKKNTALAFWSMIVVTAPIVGPILGGWISFDYTWPWIFYINIPIGIVSFMILWIALPSFETPRQKVPTDWTGLILLAIGVTCLQILLDKGEQFDWWNSNAIRILSISSIIAFSFLIVWELLIKHPLIELRLLEFRTFGLSLFFIGITYAIYFGTVVLVPLWLQTYMDYNSIWAGLAVAPIGFAPALLSTFMGKLISKVGVVIPLFICFILFSISCFYSALFTTDVDFFHVGLSRFLLGCGLTFYITPLFALSVQEIPNQQLPSATGIFHFVRAMMGGVGTSIFTTMWYRRTEYYHSIVGEKIGPLQTNSTEFFTYLKQWGIKGEKALTVVNDLVDKQAAMLGLNDTFYLLGWMFVVLIFFLPLARPKRPSTN